jgi:hypothetical protein
MLGATTTSGREGHVRHASVLLVCLLGVVVMAGCGGDSGGGDGPLSKEDYEQQMQALQADLGASADELAQAFSDPQDVEAMSEGLNDAAEVLDEASQGLADIAPPEEVADAHQTMVDKSAAAADELREFADTVANASPAELQESLGEFQSIEEFAEIQSAVTEIQAKGYNIGGS